MRAETQLPSYNLYSDNKNISFTFQAINKTEDDPFVLMFRSKNHEPNITCVRVKATIHDESLKIVNFTRTYYNKTAGEK